MSITCRSRARVVAVLSAILLVALGAAAPARCEDRVSVIPLAQRAYSSKSWTWRTELRLYNPGHEESRLRLELLPNEGNGALPLVTELEIAAGETRVFRALDDVIPVSGALVLTTVAGEPPLVVSRTYSEGTEGHWSQLVQAVDLPRPPATRYITGLAQDDELRTGLFLVNLDDAAQDVEVTVLDGDGLELATTVLEVAARRRRPVPSLLLGLGLSDPVELFSLRIVTAGEWVVAAATVSDNDSIDGSFRTDGGPMADRVVIPGAVSRPELGFTTEVTILNPSTEARYARLSGARGSALHLLAPSILPEHVWGPERGADPGGFLVVTVPPGMAVPRIEAVVVSTALEEGRRWARLPLFEPDDLIPAGGSGYLVGVSESISTVHGHRTNLALLNTSTWRWAEVQVTLLDADGGALAQILRFLHAEEMVVTPLFTALGLDPAAECTAVVAVLSGGPVAALAYEIDNTSGDAVAIPAQRR